VVQVIAEAGVNHDGSLDDALQLVDAAVEAGADVIKFQTFRADELVTAAAPKAAYQRRHTNAGESSLEMLKRLELSPEDHRALAARCGERGIAFMSTPFDSESLNLLLDLGMPTIKVSSGDLTNGPFLFDIGRSRRCLILSTGMSTLDEIEDALAVLASAFIYPDSAPTETRRRDAFSAPAGRDELRRLVTLLHCTTDYPARPEDANLRAMHTMRERFGLPVGYSDHTTGIGVAVAAAALGAVVIEKHITLDRRRPGPDHQAALEPDEFASMVRAIRAVEPALGSDEKVPAPAEAENIAAARRSLTALRPIAAGETFTSDNVGVRRPASGASPMRYWDVLGKKAGHDYETDEAIDE
jgi:N-acetylneuraminate synthase